MKKLLSLSFASLAFAAMAVDFSPSIGVQQFESVATDSFLLPVKFDSLNASAISPRELVATNGLTVGTTWLYIFQNDAYTSWNLQPTGWVAAANAGDDELAPTPPDPTQTLAAGSAIWITGVQGKNVSIYGKVITSKTSTIVRNKTNLLANPTGAPVSGSDLRTKLAGVVQAKDKISLIGDSFTGNYVYNGESWNYINGTTVTPVETLPGLAANQGLWYVSKSDLASGKSNTIQW